MALSVALKVDTEIELLSVCVCGFCFKSVARYQGVMKRFETKGRSR